MNEEARATELAPNASTLVHVFGVSVATFGVLMADLQLGPTVCGAIAWGCGMNMIMFGAVAAKEGWEVPAVSFMSAPRLLGKIGIFVSMMVCAAGAGWWALLIAPAGGMLFSGISTAVLQSNSLPASLFGGILLNVIGAIFLVAS